MRYSNIVRMFAGVIAGAMLAVGVPGLAAAQDSMVFTSWGGVTQDAQKTYWADPFTEKTKIVVKMDGPTDYGKLKAMVDSGNVTWDVVDVESDFAAVAAKDGLLEPLDFSVIPKADLDPRFVSDHSVGSFYYAYVLGFQPSIYKDNAPKNWKDLFDTAKFPGKRAFYKWSAPGAIEMALLADGVSPKELYPLDLDRAFKKLDTIKNDIVWWSSGAQSQQLLASGETPIGMFWNGRLFALQQEGTEVGISWEQNMPTADVLVVPKGAKNKDAAMKFIAQATDATAQAEFDKFTGLAPINLKALDLLPPDFVANMPGRHVETQIDLNIAYWAEHRDEIGKRWYAWQTQ